MDDETRRALLEVNRRFYEHHGESFSASRGRAWSGWNRLLPHLAGRRTLKVLDAGCGNGRLATFLADAFPGRLDYTGIDGSLRLLEAARRRLAAWEPSARLRARLELCDLSQEDAFFVTGTSELGNFDLVALFGVLHHIPGQSHRLRLVRRAAGCLDPGGLLAVSLWRFDRLPRFAEKCVPWQSLGGVEESRLEEGDHLLGWGGDSEFPRYCHLVSDAEADDLADAAGLRLLERFTDDGAGKDLNQYLILGL